MLCRTALWDCFGEAIASLIGYYEVSQETWSQLVNDNENVKVAIGLDWQNNNFARTSRFFVHFYAVVARLQRASA